eukprot:TRINITY_DN947_c0_g1_i1.p1 TRINITY_DN947_c0_g1~~TRINITY_DN947_c0_g1_i1.p1  ORF type:complete len:655 (+),score=222.60 TRINITY_DN947_c0_g1_i1:1428-3392(+)
MASTQFKKNPISDDYDLGRQLGTGKFSVVRECKNKKDGKTYAVKMITKTISEQDEVLKEIEIMRAVDEHPNVIHLIDVYEDADHFNLVLELVTGGELFDKIVEYEFYSEKEAAKLIFQIVSLVAYLHKRGIVHRDLKPENLLFEDEKATNLKLCDFGLADYIKDGESMFTLVGSPTYMAPEILDGVGYGKPVDLYSIGVVMYILLCGYPPFEPEEGITDLDFPSPEWDLISQGPKQIISALLSKEPAKRPTAADLLDHPWVKGDSASGRNLGGTIRTMKTYNTVRRNPGETMRKKDAAGKGSVFSLFDNPPAAAPADAGKPLSPRAVAAASAGGNPAISVTPATTTPRSTAAAPASSPRTSTSAPSPAGPIITTVPARDRRGSGASDKDKDKDKAAKKNRRKTATPQNKPEAPSEDSLAAKMGFSFGDTSLRDLSKKVQELGGGNAKLGMSAPSPGAADRSKELAKVSEMYSAEKKAREDAEERILELQLKLDAAMKESASSQRRAAELEEQQRVAEEQSQEKLQALELDIKKRIRESADWKLQAEKHERLKNHSETEYQNVSKKLEDALKKLAKYEQAEKIETVVAQRLETKIVQDLKKQLEAEVAARKSESKEKDALELSKNSLDKQVAELKKKVAELEEANAIMKIKLESH